MPDVFTLSHSLATAKEEDKTIKGFAVHPGVYNDIVEIPDEELENIKNSIMNTPIVYDHNFSVLAVVGKVTDAEIQYDADAQKNGVKYQGKLDSELKEAQELYKKIQKGYVNSCSIGFRHNSYCSICGKDFHECEHWFSDGAHIIAKNCEVFELSLVLKGADENANVEAFSVTNFQKQFEHKLKNGGKKMVEDHLETSQEEEKSERKEAAKMSDQETTTEETPQNEKSAETLQAEKPEKEDKLEKRNESDEILETILRKIAEVQEQLTATEEEEIIDEKVKKLNKELMELKQKYEEITKKAQEEQEKRLHKKAQELVDKEVELGIVKQKQKEERLGEVKQFDIQTLKSLEKYLAHLEETMKTEEEQKIPEIQQLNKEEEKPDMDELKQRMVHTIFRYDRVFKKDGNKVPGVSYMGFKE